MRNQKGPGACHHQDGNGSDGRFITDGLELTAGGEEPHHASHHQYHRDVIRRELFDQLLTLGLALFGFTNEVLDFSDGGLASHRGDFDINLTGEVGGTGVHLDSSRSLNRHCFTGE